MTGKKERIEGRRREAHRKTKLTDRQEDRHRETEIILQNYA